MTPAEARQMKRQANNVLKAERKARQRVRPVKIKATPVKPDRGRERDNGFLAFVRRQPCAARHLGGCEGRIDPAHIRFGTPDRPNPGMGRKNHDRWCNPLCRKHHEEQHSMKEQAFWARVGIDPAANAAALYAEYSRPTLKGEVSRG